MIFKIILLSIIISSKVFAVTTAVVEYGDNLDVFAKRNIKNFVIKYGNDVELFKNDIKKWNSRITDWNHLKFGEPLFVDYPYPYFVSETPYTDKPEMEIHGIEHDQTFSMFSYITSSLGSYSEQTYDQTVKSGQNFPITLGTSLSLSNEARIHFLNSSIYWAKSADGKIVDNLSANSNIKTPGELGYNLYYQYFIHSNLIGINAGYDFEKLNTFNTDKLVLGSKLENISNNLNYATFGINKSFALGENIFSIKTSYSTILKSSTNGTKNLSGSRYLLYFSFRPIGRFSYNILYKHHDLNGPTKLTINRIGISIGFQLF